MEIIKGKPLSLLPPPKDCCQECGVKHNPKDPHNAQSLYYCTKFNMENERSPTWADAMAHCSEETQAFWKEYLEGVGIDIDSTNKTEDTEEDSKIKAECLVEEALDQLTEVENTYDIEEINAY